MKKNPNGTLPDALAAFKNAYPPNYWQRRIELDEWMSGNPEAAELVARYPNPSAKPPGYGGKTMQEIVGGAQNFNLLSDLVRSRGG